MKANLNELLLVFLVSLSTPLSSNKNRTIMAHIKTSVIRFYYFLYRLRFVAPPAITHIFRSILSSFPSIVSRCRRRCLVSSTHFLFVTLHLNWITNLRHVFVDFYSSFVFIYRRYGFSYEGGFFFFLLFNGEEKYK